jgi:hypothetical protein
MAVGGQGYVPAALPPGNGPGTHCTGGWDAAMDNEAFEWQRGGPNVATNFKSKQVNIK